MAISLKTAGTWARVVTDPSSVTIPGTPAAGDRMFLFANWKTFSITVADPTNWTPIVNSNADGTTASGVGSGSVSVAAWYRDWQSGDGNPSLNWSASPTEAHAVVMLWTKAGGDTWSTPQFRTGAIASADPFSVNASATVTVSDASVVIGMIALADDSSTIARATDAIDDTGGLVTWNGNYVESPATHFSSTTGQDMSGDMGHRLVTTGAAGVTLHMDGDPAAAETGNALFVLQALFVSDPKTATPTTVALTTATFAPTVTASDKKTATPTTAALTSSAFAPTITTTQHQLVTPTTQALTLSTFAPTVTASDHKTVTPTTQALTLSTFAPTASTPRFATPTTEALILTTFVPTVSVASGGVTVTPSTTGLTTSAFAPTVTATANQRAVPGTASFTSSTFAPTVSMTADVLATPTTAVLTLTTFRPRVVRPSGGGFRPVVRGGMNFRIVPRPALMLLYGHAPTIVLNDDDMLFGLLEEIA